MRRLISVFAAAGCLAACNGDFGEEDKGAASPQAVASDTATSVSSATAVADAQRNGARSVSEQTDDYVFEYAYPSEAGNIPALADLLDRRLDKNKADLAKESAEARVEARENGFPYNKHSYNAEWKVVADLPEWLSLSSEIATYSGGAHGMYGFGSLVWNKSDEKAIEAVDMFESTAALDEALGDKLCKALDVERAKRRGEAVPEDSDAEFDRCVSVDEATVLVGSAGRRKFDRVGLQLGPYVAGPYVEGAYEFTFPVDTAVLKAVKAEYRDSFAARN